MNLFAFTRRPSSLVQVGNTALGESMPIRIQSMANVSTMDLEASVSQALRMVEAGAEYIRFTAQGVKEAQMLGKIKAALLLKGVNTPLVADIHFNPKAAFEALNHVEKVRINPGNFAELSSKGKALDDTFFDEGSAHVEAVFSSFLSEAKKLGRAVRIGVNHGSLSERMMLRYGDTPRGMVMSAMEYLRICKMLAFDDVVISMKASNVLVMTEAVRLLVSTMDQEDLHYPLHLGVTEAGEGDDGRVKSAVGIGSLLLDGLGDTIRVSLSEEPEAELPVCRALVAFVEQRMNCRVDAPNEAKLYQRSYLQRLDSSVVADIIGANKVPLVFARYADKHSFSDDAMALKPDFFLDEYAVISDSEAKLSDFELVAMDASRFDVEKLSSLRNKSNVVLMLSSSGVNPLAEWRSVFLQMQILGITAPVILHKHYQSSDANSLRLEASIDMGSLLLEGRGNALFITAENVSATVCVEVSYSILQATRLRMSKTEYISCPGCGRTLYNLQETLARIKAATSHLKGLKIAVMGCIVNGPGEMADADYGYVGSAPGCVDLYKQKECLMKAIPQEKAVDSLIELIRKHGDWHEANEIQK